MSERLYEYAEMWRGKEDEARIRRNAERAMRRAEARDGVTLGPLTEVIGQTSRGTVMLFMSPIITEVPQ